MTESLGPLRRFVRSKTVSDRTKTTYEFKPPVPRSKRVTKTESQGTLERSLLNPTWSILDPSEEREKSSSGFVLRRVNGRDRGEGVGVSPEDTGTFGESRVWGEWCRLHMLPPSCLSVLSLVVSPYWNEVSKENFRETEERNFRHHKRVPTA